MSKVLLTEIKNVLIISLILGAVQVIITIPAGYFGVPAVLGTLLGIFAAVFNFALMGWFLEKCMSKNGVRTFAGLSYIARLAIIAVIIVWAMKVSYLNYVCVIIPLIFPQIAIFLINAKRRRGADKNERS